MIYNLFDDDYQREIQSKEIERDNWEKEEKEISSKDN